MSLALELGPFTGRAEADRIPEDRGLARDAVRLMVSDRAGDRDARFRDLPDLLRPGDLLVVNESATLPASLPARGRPGDFLVNLSTRYGPDLWLAESRWSASRPGPVPLARGERITVGGVGARWVAAFPGTPRLAFLHTESDLGAAMERVGRPIRYAYLAHDYPLDAYQTVFARVPGSAEMPSAGRPFSRPLVDRLLTSGIRIATVVLHTGVSSLEIDPEQPDLLPSYPEPFRVPSSTADAIRAARARGGRVIAVGTTVVRALESALDGDEVHATEGFTRLVVTPERPTRVVDGLLTGFHDARSTHLELLAAVAGAGPLRRSYARAVEQGYLWHEFGDSQLWLPN